MADLIYQDGFARPWDVPEYVPKAKAYATGGAAKVVGDGVGTRGSPMPVLAIQLDDIPSTAPGWLVPGSVPPVAGDTDEAKFRAHANVSHIAYDDPIRAFGQPGASHLHIFLGSTSLNAFSTYESLRNRANEFAANGQVASTTAGGPYNASGYWIPALMLRGQVAKPGQFFIYYTANPATRSRKGQRLPRGLRYVTGCNMDDPLDSAARARVDAANAVPGTNYTYLGNGFNTPHADGTFTSTNGSGWSLLEDDLATPVVANNGDTVLPYFCEADGTNPWSDNVDPDAWYWLKAFLNGPVGFDGDNLWAPGGYDHVCNPVRDNNASGDDQTTIYQGWHFIPELQMVPFWRIKGSDIVGLRLSSDDHAAMVAGIAPEDWPGGASFHGDWFGAWHDGVFGADTGWQIQCIGVKDGVICHECASGCFSADGMRLLGSIGGDNAPDGSRTPQLTLPEIYDTTNPDDMFSLSGTTGPVTVPALAA